MTAARARLVLFDIDGTLVAGGPAKEAFRRALLETYGTVGDFEGVSFGGKTDPQIARELLGGAGMEPDGIDEGLPRLWELYLTHLEEGLAQQPMQRLPGVVELLEALRETGGFAVGLLTGNIEPGARLKLGSVELADHFGFGGFGSDHEERNALPAIALRRAREFAGVEFGARDAVIIGDTPLDVACGRSGGTRTVAVATGSFGTADLLACGADHVLEDLSRTERVIELLLDSAA